MNFSDLNVFPIFVIFIFKLDANFPGEINVFSILFIFFGFIRQKNTSISAISKELD